MFSCILYYIILYYIILYYIILYYITLYYIIIVPNPQSIFLPQSHRPTISRHTAGFTQLPNQWLQMLK